MSQGKRVIPVIEPDPPGPPPEYDASIWDPVKPAKSCTDIVSFIPKPKPKHELVTVYAVSLNISRISEWNKDGRVSWPLSFSD